MQKKWWKEAVVYQIYPLSFFDSNGDGFGDLNGIVLKLDYLKELGVNILWLNPIYQSPLADNGYDVSSYKNILDKFGTIDDFLLLLSEAHRRKIKIILDIPLVCTSEEHPWFIESRSSRTNERRDYYIWADGHNGKEPNNWESMFHGSVWQWDNHTRQYYYHLFTPEQPDLNWKNVRMRKELYEVLRWWLDKGVDGFRMDVGNGYAKPDNFIVPEDDVKNNGYVPRPDCYFNQPGIHDYIREMNREVFSRYDMMTVAECEHTTLQEALLYVGEERKEYNMVFHFELMHLDEGPGGWFDLIPWKLSDFKKIITKWQLGLQKRGWGSLYLNNHDQPRMVSRFGNDGEFRVESAKMLATLLHTLQGTPFIYQGEEIGMTNVSFHDIEAYNDVFTRNYYRKAVENDKKNRETILKTIHAKSRDNARTPMQWSGSESGGFTSGVPWMKPNPNYREINVKEAMADPDSIFHYYRKLIRLRRENEVFVYGEYKPLLEKDERIIAYLRELEKKRLLIIINFYGEPVVLKLPSGVVLEEKKLMISNYPDHESHELENLSLRPYEARVYELL